MKKKSTYVCVCVTIWAFIINSKNNKIYFMSPQWESYQMSNTSTGLSPNPLSLGLPSSSHQLKTI